MDRILPNGIIGTDQKRIDGMAKVTGRAMYGADHTPGAVAHAYTVTADIARGKVRNIDERAARAMRGVLEILTYKNVGKTIRPGKHIIDGGYLSHTVTPLRSNKIFFSGQIVAVVLAETLEIAQAAGEALVIRYKEKRPAGTLDSRGAKVVKAKALGETELSAGKLKRGLSEASAIVDTWYETPAQVHNPLELFQTTCAWEDDELTVWESSQNVRGYQHGLAKQLGISPKKIRILSPFIGGAFGSRGELGQNTALVALAAKRIGRPVKHVATRRDCFTLRTYRAETRHHICIGADPGGRLTALLHESWENTSRSERFAVTGSDSTARLYACPNVKTKVKNVETDRQAPGFMRAPPEMPYMFAMESAMDELAHQLRLDPVDLRKINDTLVETVTGRPYTSRSLVPCLERGAELFGWSRRNPEPLSMRDGDEYVGWGMASAFYPTQVGPAQCRVTLMQNLRAVVEVGTHEIGTGIRTVIAMTASDLLGLRVDDVSVRIGDSQLPAAPMSAGSNSTASVCSVVAKACEVLRRRIAARAILSRESQLRGVRLKDVRLQSGFAVAGERQEPLQIAVARAGRGQPMVVNAKHTPHGAPPFIGPFLIGLGKPLMLGGSRLKDRMQFAHGAHFVEVRINAFTGQIRVSRAVGVFAAGRIMNTRTARAQLQGGQVWGIASALLEAAEVDARRARYVNADLSEYHLAVNADIETIETVMLDETDTLVNPLGIKGVGELGVTGMAAAIANAVFHATGVRLRKLPIRGSDVLQRIGEAVRR